MADYKPLPKLTDLDPGIRVYGFNILVLPRELEEKTTKGIFIPESSREREDEAGIEGMIIAAGQFAFNFEDAAGVVTPWDDRPQTGDVVMFARYAGGRNFTGTDGRKYRIMQDKDILGARASEKASKLHIEETVYGAMDAMPKFEGATIIGPPSAPEAVVHRRGNTVQVHKREGMSKGQEIILKSQLQRMGAL